MFYKKGFGTIVTGTVEQGKAKIGDIIEILPNDVRSKNQRNTNTWQGC